MSVSVRHGDTQSWLVNLHGHVAYCVGQDEALLICPGTLNEWFA